VLAADASVDSAPDVEVAGDREASRLQHGDEDVEEPRPATSAGAPKLGRNDPCYCGSGLKYKKCHGK